MLRQQHRTEWSAGENLAACWVWKHAVADMLLKNNHTCLPERFKLETQMMLWMLHPQAVRWMWEKVGDMEILKSYITHTQTNTTCRLKTSGTTGKEERKLVMCTEHVMFMKLHATGYL